MHGAEDQKVGGEGGAGGVDKVSKNARAYMEQASAELHLAHHMVRGKGTLCCAGDVEVHLGNDGRFYVLDMARAMPCEDPQLTTHLVHRGQTVFFRLLRPEVREITLIHARKHNCTRLDINDT